MSIFPIVNHVLNSNGKNMHTARYYLYAEMNVDFSRFPERFYKCLEVW